MGQKLVVQIEIHYVLILSYLKCRHLHIGHQNLSQLRILNHLHQVDVHLRTSHRKYLDVTTGLHFSDNYSSQKFFLVNLFHWCIHTVHHESKLTGFSIGVCIAMPTP